MQSLSDFLTISTTIQIFMPQWAVDGIRWERENVTDFKGDLHSQLIRKREKR